jgi:hypothetical protein
MILTTAIKVAGLEPAADVGLSLQQQGNTVTSQLHWLRLGFLSLPARWLPQDIVELGTQVGPQIAAQLPPQFMLVGLTTTTDGISLQLDLVEE